MLRFGFRGSYDQHTFDTREEAMGRARIWVDEIITLLKEKNKLSLELDQMQAERDPISAWELIRTQFNMHIFELSIFPVDAGDYLDISNDDLISKFATMLK
jgi:hypothetical protein